MFRIFPVAPLLRLAAVLITGIITAYYFPAEWPLVWLLPAVLVVTILLWRWPVWQSATIAACFFVLGMVLTQHEQTLRQTRVEKGVCLQPSRIEQSKLYFMGWREQLLQRLRQGGVDDDEYAVVAAMVLGDRSAMPRELREGYNVTGAAHILALSGLHLGIVYGLLSLLIARGRKRIVSQVLLILSIWLFVLMTGMSVSVVRAAIMLTVYALLSLGHRDRMSLNTLAFTAIIMLVVNPYALFDVGFQMSFMAVAAILLFMPLARMVFSEAYLMRHRVLKWLWGIVWVSCAAQIGVAPLIAYYFGRFSTWFLLTNFIVIPAAWLILYLAVVVMVVPSCAYLLVHIVGRLNAVVAWLSQLPLASIDDLHPTKLQTAMTYVVIAACYLLLCRLATYSRASAVYRSGWLPPSGV